jgi:hypothetical protein
VTAVHFLDHVQFEALVLSGEALREEPWHRLLFDLFDLHIGTAYGCALVFAGKETGAPIILAPMAESGFDGDEAGEVLVFGTSPWRIQEPILGRRKEKTPVWSWRRAAP